MSTNWDQTGTPQPPNYPAYPAPSPTSIAGTNVCAVLSLVLAFVCAPAGLVLGIVALRQIGRNGEGGRGLALAGTIVSALGVVFVLLIFVFWFGVSMQ